MIVITPLSFCPHAFSIQQKNNPAARISVLDCPNSMTFRQPRHMDGQMSAADAVSPTYPLSEHAIADARSIAVTIVASCQFAPKIGAVGENIAHGRTLIEQAAERGARVVVLPELASSGYVFENTAEAAAAAVSPGGPELAPWRDASNHLGVVVVAGFCESGGAGKPFISALILVPGNDPVVYRKVHLWDRERLIFAAGSAPPPVVDTPIGRIAAMICYDLEFPEWVRIPALEGADLICAPVNWPAGRRPPGERPGEVVRVQAQAAMNRVAIAVCDRTGTERGVGWTSASVIVDADGWPKALADAAVPGETILSADIDLADSRDKRIAEYSDVMADRRPDLYHP
ncbi:MAG: nitrilase-related carbon-nitrogen hydrolase [Gordonia sp. (in: high G+C Gram-positive bacteria)]